MSTPTTQIQSRITKELITLVPELKPYENTTIVFNIVAVSPNDSSLEVQ